MMVWDYQINVGEVYLAIMRPWGAQTGVSGSGRLATVTFSVDAIGAGYLRLDGVGLIDPFGTEITTDVFWGYFSSLPETTFLADLTKRKSTNRPEYHIFKISVHGTTQTLYGEVKNLGTAPVLTRVRFESFDEMGLPPPGGGIMYSATVLLQPKQSAVLSGNMPIDSSMIGRWYGTNYCEYDSNGDGTLDATGVTTMSWSFTVRP